MKSPEKLAWELVEENRDLFESTTKEWAVNIIAALIRKDREEMRERCAKIAENPYGDPVRAFANSDPLTVGFTIAQAIRKLKG